MDLPFEIGALYSRRTFIHPLLGGQQQGGISTPSNYPVVLAFTGEAGVAHGYRDFWDDDEVLHYYGEGQHGDMRFTAGNRAIENHVSEGKHLLLFQMMGKGRPYRYLGEFESLSSYLQPDTPDTLGRARVGIVFRLRRVGSRSTKNTFFDATDGQSFQDCIDVGETSARRLVEVRTKQRLFRERLIGVERGCRVTGVEDLRFLRASHIKPWALCTSAERVDGQNGLLLAPNVDLLFDRGWISFENDGNLLVSNNLPEGIRSALSVNFAPTVRPVALTEKQIEHMGFHRDVIFLRSA